jgi:transcriptional regulator with XRE-family HTH domain
MQASPFGRWLRAERTRLRFSQAYLARLASMHRLQICYLETGRTALPRPEARRRLYGALGLQPPTSIIAASKVRGRAAACSFCSAQLVDEVPSFRSSLRAVICQKCIQQANQFIAGALRAQRSMGDSGRARADLARRKDSFVNA